jgi:hypothetical protein
MPLSISTVDISLPLQERVALLPVVIEVGLTESAQVGPPAPPPPPVVTVTAAVHVADCPVGLMTVPVKVVLAGIARELTEPPIAGETAPIPLSMVKVAPFVVVQVSVVCSP